MAGFARGGFATAHFSDGKPRISHLAARRFTPLSARNRVPASLYGGLGHGWLPFRLGGRGVHGDFATERKSLCAKIPGRNENDAFLASAVKEGGLSNSRGKGGIYMALGSNYWVLWRPSPTNGRSPTISSLESPISNPGARTNPRCSRFKLWPPGQCYWTASPACFRALLPPLARDMMIGGWWALLAGRPVAPPGRNVPVGADVSLAGVPPPARIADGVGLWRVVLLVRLACWQAGAVAPPKLH